MSDKLPFTQIPNKFFQSHGRDGGIEYRSQGLTTICVKPGFVKTAMTAGLPTPPFAGEPDDVAQTVIEGIDAGTPIVYAPKIWRAVMTAIKAMPRFIMRRAKF